MHVLCNNAAGKKVATRKKVILRCMYFATTIMTANVPAAQPAARMAGRRAVGTGHTRLVRLLLQYRLQSPLPACPGMGGTAGAGGDSLPGYRTRSVGKCCRATYRVPGRAV